MGDRVDKKNSKPEHLAKFIPEGFYHKYSVWLDCASGDGFMVADYFFGSKNRKGIGQANYIAVDIDPTKLQRLKDDGRKVICIDLEKESIKDHISKVKIILSIETLEHLTYETAKRVMDDFISVLIPGGMMLISFPRVVRLSEKNTIDKHQPNVDELSEYAKYFNSFYKEEWRKSWLLVFKDKK